MKKTGKVLMVDDEASLVWAFQKFITSMGHDFLSASTAEEGVVIARREKPDLIFMDVRLPGKDGLWAVEEIRKATSSARIVVLTAHGTLETAVTAMKRGAVEYLSKPLDLERARRVVQEALEGRSRQVEDLRDEARSTGIVGRTPAMQEVFRQVAAVSQSDVTVLLVGESGTGKELLARAIHSASGRGPGPFEAINCASIPETLLESELYGHERGAFTGAIRSKPGKFEVADGGTLFLDEIGDLAPSSQVKLLRFLEDRVLERVGGTERITVNVRVVAATNQNLEERIAQGRFREDLYFRLNVVRIEIPPLRDRRDDIPLLVARFVQQTGAAGVSDEVLRILREYSWPGNVRELRSVIERGAVLARGRVIGREHLPETVLTPRPAGDLDARIGAIVGELLGSESARRGEIYRRVEERWEKELLRQVLERTEGNQLKASELLGINRLTLRKRVRKYGL